MATLPKNKSGVPDSAKAIVQQFLGQYGLASLSGWAWDVYVGAGGGNVGMDAITAELPNTTQFKARFPAYEQLRKEGRAMSVQEMLSYEQTARQIFQAHGLPQGFYDTPQELGQFMVHNVSTSELEARVRDAQVAMISSPQDVRNQLQRLYNIDHGHLTAFFLDPTKAEPLLAQKFTAAQIASEAHQTDYGQISRQQAEMLAQQGVTDQQAQQGFEKLGTQKGLFDQQVAGEQSVGVDEQIAAQFGGNVTAQQAFLQRQAQRLAAFQEQSGFGATRTGVAGLGQTPGGA